METGGPESNSVTSIPEQELRNIDSIAPPQIPPRNDSIQEVLTLFAGLSLFEKDRLVMQLKAIVEKEFDSALENQKEQREAGVTVGAGN